MINIILTILKVLGIIILCILCILLFLALCVLLVPIRYFINGEYDDSFLGSLKLTWFFHIISLSIAYNKNAVIKFKIFGIPISLNKKEKKKKAQHKKTEVVKSKPDLQACEDKKDSDKLEVNNIEIESDEVKETESKEKIETQSKPPKKLSIWKRIIRFFNNIIKKMKSFLLNLKSIISNINYYIDLYNSEEAKKTISTCKKRLIKLYKTIRPNMMKINIFYGLEDPSNTAKILSFYSMLYAYIGHIIYLFPNYEEPVLKAYIKGKGKIIPARVGYQILRVFLDKNCRRIIQMLKKENLHE